MSEVNSTGSESTTPQPEERGSLFEEFRWHHIDPKLADYRAAELASLVADVTGGITTALQIMENDDHDGGCCDDEGKTLPTYLPDHHADRMRRLCIASLTMLNEKAHAELWRATEAARGAT